MRTSFRNIASIMAVASGCLSIFCICLIALILVFQAPLGQSYSPLIAQLHADIWKYLLVDSQQVLMNHAGLVAHEERHLLDVKQLIWVLFSITPLCIIVFGISIYRAPMQRRRSIYCGMAFLGVTLVGVALLCVALLGFRWGFVYFHKALFAPGTWWFTPDSGLIQAFPIIYFQQLALFWCLLLVTVFAALYFLGCKPHRKISSSAGIPS